MTKKDYCMNCWGTGKVPDFWDNDKEVICPHCSGTGIEPPITNDKWRRTCSAEEFSKWLEDKMTWAAQEQGTFTAKGWEMWLKEIHSKE